MMENIENTLGMLRGAASADYNVRKENEKLMQDCESRPGFCSTLFQIAQLAPNELDTDLRTLAMICLKNTINRNWSSRSNQGVIGDNEKVMIRAGILRSLSVEPCRIVAQQAQMVVAKIARFDWPRAWPNLFDSLVEMIQNPKLPTPLQASSQWDVHAVETTLRWRALGALYAVIKVLASKRLGMHRKAFGDLSAVLLQGLCGFWCETAQSVFTRMANIDATATMEVAATILSSEVLLKCTKCIEQLVVHGDAKRNFQHAWFRQFMEQLFDFMVKSHDTRSLRQVLFTHPSTFPASDPHASLRNTYLECVIRRPLYLSHEKSLKTIMNIAYGAQQQFSLMVSPFLDLFVDNALRIVAESSAGCDSSIYTDEPPLVVKNGYTESVVVVALGLLSNVVKQPEYRSEPPESSTAEDLALLSQAHAVIQSRFGAEQVVQICKTLIGRMLILQFSDLEQWRNSPQEYASLQESLSKDDGVRPAAEDLLLSLVDVHDNIVTSSVVTMLMDHEKLFPVDQLVHLEACKNCGSGECSMGNCGASQHEVRQRGALVLPHHVNVREALYIATGLLAFNIYDKLDFPSFMVTSLIPLLESSRNETAMVVTCHQVLHRRCLWLIGCWVASLTAELRPPLYSATVQLMGSGSKDILVRLGAAKTLQSLIADWDCDVNALAQVQQNAVEALFLLIQNIEVNELRQQIVAIVSELAHRLQQNLRPCLRTYLSKIPWLWDFEEDAGEQSLIRASVLTLLNHLVVFSSSTVEETGNNDTEASKLLSAVVTPIIAYSTDTSQPEHLYLLDDALSLWVSLCQSSTTYTNELHSLFERFGALTVTGATENLRDYMSLIQAYTILGGNTFMEAYHDVIRRCLTCVIGDIKPRAAVYPTVTVELILRLYPSEGAQILQDVIASMITSCLDSANYKKSGASTARFIDPDLVVAGYLCVTARLACTVPNWFDEFLLQHPNNPAPLDFVDLWLTLFDVAGSYTSISGRGVTRRQLYALALCSVLCRSFGNVPVDQLLQVTGPLVNSCAQVIRELREHQMGNDTSGDPHDSLANDEQYDSDSIGEICGSGMKSHSTSIQSRQVELFTTDPLLQNDVRQAVLLYLKLLGKHTSLETVTKLLEEQPRSSIDELAIQQSDLH